MVQLRQNQETGTVDFPVAVSDDYLERKVELEERRSALLTVRSPSTLGSRIKDLADYLTKKDRMNNKDARKTTSGDVVVRLLVLGLEGAWTQAGLSPKPDKAEIDAKLRSLKSPS